MLFYICEELTDHNHFISNEKMFNAWISYTANNILSNTIKAPYCGYH